jgi:lipid A 4'-phosphatase
MNGSWKAEICENNMMNTRILYRHGLVWIASVVAVLLVLSWLTVRWNLDLRIAQRFYVDGSWYLAKKQPWRFLYDYGTLPGIMLSIAALLIWLGGYLSPRLAPWRRYCLLVVLTTVLGAGLLVNAVFKPNWGRPRPGQIEAFGGTRPFHPVYLPGIPGQGASFPSGHPTMGFIFTTLFFFRARWRALAYTGSTFGLVAGGLLGMARIVQGGHFLSDVFWSLGMLLLVSIVLYYFVLRIPMTSVKAVTATPALP